MRTGSDFSIVELADKVRARMAGREEISDEAVLELCEEVVLSAPELAARDLSEKSGIIRAVFCTLRRELEILQDLADDPTVSEIMVNGTDGVFVEREGRISEAEVGFESPAQLLGVIQRLAARVSRELNELNPIVDARLSDGSRINAVNSNVAIGGPILTIRRFNAGRLTMEDLIEGGCITREAADFLEELVRCRYNIFVSGGTSSGKTTFLNVLSDFIPEEERLIVIEDSAELAIRGHPDLVRLEAKLPNAQGKGAVTIRELIKASLRMRPDRIIVGEVRGAEVVDMLAAMSTGHDGSLSTGHSNSCRGMVLRLESLFLSASGFPIESIRGQIAEGIDIFVHLARSRDGRRRVMEISQLGGISAGEIELEPLFRLSGGELRRTGAPLRRTEKLELYGSGGGGDD